MRSSKSRSRSKANRPRTLGNIINRVFDSSGPEGKVRGTPQQIIEKYQMLARDAQLSNDRVAAENFLQHAEHYTRLLAEAMREQAAEQESRMQNGGQNGGQNGWQNREAGRFDAPRDVGEGDQPYVGAIDVVDGEAGLVELPEQDRSQRNAAPRQQPRQNDGRQNDGRQYDGRQNNRANDRPRDDRNRDDRNRDDRNRDNRNRDNQRDDRRDAPKPAPELRFVDTVVPETAPADPLPVEPVAVGAVESPKPVFISPAELVAQVAEAPAPKPRASRAKAKPRPEEGKLDL